MARLSHKWTQTDGHCMICGEGFWTKLECRQPDVSPQFTKKVDSLAVEIQRLAPAETVEFLGVVIRLLKGRNLLQTSLRQLSSTDWQTLYRAVIEVEAGL